MEAFRQVAFPLALLLGALYTAWRELRRRSYVSGPGRKL